MYLRKSSLVQNINDTAVNVAQLPLFLVLYIQDLSSVRMKASLDRSFGSLQFYTLKPQLQVLLFHLIVSILLALMLALAVSSRLSSLLFQLFVLPVSKGKTMDQLNIVPGAVLLLSVVVGVLPSLVLAVILVVEWAITAFKVK